MKKVLAIVLTLSLCFASLAGCGSSPSDTPSAPAADPSAPQAGDAAEPVKLIMAIEVSSNTACAQASKSFAEMVKEKSGGSIEVDVSTDGTLGNENELWEAVQTGSVDIVWSGDGAVSANVPEWGFVALPYVFSSPEARDQFVHGGDIAQLNQILEEKGNIVVLGNGSGATRNLIADKEIKTLGDAAGITMRVQQSDIVVATWKALGLLPTVIAYSETYSALQTGVAEAAENEMSTLITQKWYECCPYIIETEHQINCHPLYIGADQWAKLTGEQQAILKECGQAAADEFVTSERANSASDLEEMLGDGAQVCELTDKQAWIDATESVRKEFCEQYGLTELLEKVQQY